VFCNFWIQKGSFPAFWLNFDAPCDYDYGSEIDIVELKYEEANTGLDNHAWYYPCTGGWAPVPGSWKDNSFNWSTETPHTFKCIWTPTKIEWYVDNTKTHTITNTGNNHYPNKTMAIILSQQLYPYNHKMNNIDVPVTSVFHWVRAKEFFLAPEISCPPVICSSGTAARDVDSSADSITWSLTPTTLFSGNKTGNGKNASITAATGASGQGKITYTFKMPSGETFTAEKTFWVGVPAPEYIDFVNIGPNYPGSMVLCNDMPNDGKVRWNGVGNVLEYSWSVYDDGSNTWQVVQHPMVDSPMIPMEDVQFSKPYGSVNGWVNVKVKARNQCSGWGNINYQPCNFQLQVAIPII
jgi:hypothetical protein